MLDDSETTDNVLESQEGNNIARKTVAVGAELKSSQNKNAGYAKTGNFWFLFNRVTVSRNA